MKHVSLLVSNACPSHVVIVSKWLVSRCQFPSGELHRELRNL